MENQEKNYKVLIFGTQNVGKSSIITRYTEEKFGGIIKTFFNYYSNTKEWDLDGKIMKIKFERVCSTDDIKENIINDLNAIIFIYDVKCIETFNPIIEAHKQFFKLTSCKFPKNFPILLIGNKYDFINEEIEENEALNKFIKESKFYHFKVSAKSNLNIDIMFENLVQQINTYDKHLEEDKIPDENTNRVESKTCIIF